MDRSELMNGVWDDDIDKYPEVSYIYTAPCGYKCEIRRNGYWAYCGYVFLPSDHPYYNLKYDELDISVHGGLTFGHNGKYGFDCAHNNDLVPGFETFQKKYGYDKIFNEEKKYWSYGDVEKETNEMAKQFFDIANH